MGKVFAMPPRAVAAPAFDLFAVTEGSSTGSDQPRDARPEEVRQYLLWVAMPGYGQSQTVVCELLDDAGDVVKTMPLPVDRRGKLPMNAAQVQEWTGLERVKKARKAPTKRDQPEKAPTEPETDLRAVVAALAAQVALLTETLAAQPADTRRAVQPGGIDARDAYIAELITERDELREAAIAAGDRAADFERIAKAAEAKADEARDVADDYQARWEAVSRSAAAICAERDALAYKRKGTARRLARVRRERFDMACALIEARDELAQLRPLGAAIAAFAQSQAAPAPAPTRRRHLAAVA
jgi:hypothetical protein